MKNKIGLLLLLFLAGCATPPESENPSEETNTELAPEILAAPSTPPVQEYFYPIDLKDLVRNLVNSLLDSHAVGDRQPLIAFNKVKDKTSLHLDTQAISQEIRDQLRNSGQVNLVDDDNADAGIDFDKPVRVRDNSRPSKSRFDKLKAKNYRLLAVIYDQPLKKYDLNEQYYRMTLSLLDLNSNQLIWIDEQENLKRSRYER